MGKFGRGVARKDLPVSYDDRQSDTTRETAVLDALLRPVKDRLLIPVARPLGAVAPTLITLLGLIAGLGSALAAWQRAYGIAVAGWVLSRILDGLDGVLARVHRRQTDLGGYLDQLADFAIYAAVPLGLVAGRNDPALLWPALLLLAVYYINAASWLYLSAILERRQIGAAARGEQTTIAMPGGLIGGSETILFYLAFLLWPDALRPLFLVFAGLVALTALQRVGWAWRKLRPTRRSA